MKAVRKVLLIVLILLPVLAILGLGGLNLFLRSGSVRLQIESAARAATNMPVHIDSISYTPWGGLKVNGARISERQEIDSPAFLRTEQITLRVRLLPLLSRREVYIDEILIGRPIVTVRNDDKGSPVLPEIPEAPTIAKETKPEGKPEPAASETQSVKQTPPPPVVQVGRIRIADASATLSDPKGKVQASLSGLNARATIESATLAAGSLEIAEITVAGLASPLKSIKTPFSYAVGVLDLPSLTADFAGGKLTLSATLETRREDSTLPLRLKGNLLGLSLGELTAASDIALVGRLVGQIEMRGNLAEPDSLRGRATFEARDAKLDHATLVQSFGRLLQIPELVSLQFDQATLEATFKARDLRIQECRLASENMRLTAEGTIKDFEKLNLDSVLEISTTLADRVPKRIISAFEEPVAEGWKGIRFQIKGTLSSPKSNLQDKILKATAKSTLTGLLDDLFSSETKEQPTSTPGTPALPPEESEPQLTPGD
ncbi:MAG: AsmA family protein [Verrucomicrobiia bacterium]